MANEIAYHPRMMPEGTDLRLNTQLHLLFAPRSANALRENVYFMWLEWAKIGWISPRLIVALRNDEGVIEEIFTQVVTLLNPNLSGQE